jgi:hypothetical protein
MNSPNYAATLRSLIIYAICVPLAIVVGYLMTNPMDYSTLGLFGILALLLASPLLLRWHYLLLVLSWNMTIILFFLKGSPSLWLVMVALSLGISLLERALSSQMSFIRVPQITWPLICLAAAVLITAKFTGGFGLRSFGSDVYGSKKYVFLMAGILSYFALTSRRIPPERAGLYVALFFLGGVTNLIGDLFAVLPGWFHFVFWLVPPNLMLAKEFEFGQTRMGGFALAGFLVWCFLLARYGIRGIFLSGKLWRAFAFFLSFSAVFLGGFRSGFIALVLIFALQFFLEGLHRTPMLPIAAGVGILAAVSIVPFAPKLPVTFQRTLAFLPLDLDPQVKTDAQASLDWRVNMWKALLPQVPQYLLLGKGMAISTEEFNEVMGSDSVLGGAAAAFDPSQNALALSSDFHNGPLSVVIPFGIWGCIAVIWFWTTGLRVLYSNFKYGDPLLRTYNVFLFVDFLVSLIQFLFIGGALSSDLAKFAGILGLSIALNGGVCQPAPKPVPVGEAFLRPRGVLPRSQPHPAFPQ